MQDKIRIGLSALVFIGGLAGFYYLAQQPMVARVGAILVGIGLAVAIGWTTAQGTVFRGYVQESVDEARKVAWPSRKESMQTTAIVFVFVVVMALFLWIVDKLLEWSLYDLILRWTSK